MHVVQRLVSWDLHKVQLPSTGAANNSLLVLYLRQVKLADFGLAKIAEDLAAKVHVAACTDLQKMALFLNLHTL